MRMLRSCHKWYNWKAVGCCSAGRKMVKIAHAGLHMKKASPHGHQKEITNALWKLHFTPSKGITSSKLMHKSKPRLPLSNICDATKL